MRSEVADVTGIVKYIGKSVFSAPKRGETLPPPHPPPPTPPPMPVTIPETLAGYFWAPVSS